MKKDTSVKDTMKTVLLVFAILFSVVFVPVLVLLPPVGGSIVATMEMMTLDRMEEITEESGIAESVYDAVLEEITEGLPVTQLKPEVTGRILKNSLQVADFEQWITLLLEGIYTGDTIRLDLGKLQERVEKQVEALTKDGFDEVYAVWKDGADTVNLSKEYVEELLLEWENDLLSQYEMYGARDMKGLEQVYDEKHGEGAFGRLCEEKINELREEWDGKVTETIKAMVADGFAEAEAQVAERLQEVVKNPEVREAFAIVQEAGTWSNNVRLVVYGMLFGIVLLLLLLYWFEIPGFVVTAVPLFVGGALCKLLTSQGGRIRTWICEEAFADMGENEKVLSISSSLLERVLGQLFDSISAFGTVALIVAFALTGGAILRGVLKRNKKAVEESYQ